MVFLRGVAARLVQVAHGQRQRALIEYLVGRADESGRTGMLALATMARAIRCTPRHTRRLLRSLPPGMLVVETESAQHDPRAYRLVITTPSGDRTSGRTSDRTLPSAPTGHSAVRPSPAPPPSINSSIYTADPSAVIALWNRTAPRCTPLTTPPSVALRRQLERAVRAHPLDWWAATFAVANATAFLVGRGGRGWRATLGWMLRPGKADAVRAGAYWRPGDGMLPRRRPAIAASRPTRALEAPAAAELELEPAALPEPLARWYARLRERLQRELALEQGEQAAALRLTA